MVMLTTKEARKRAMPTVFEAIEGWIDEARAKLEDGGIQKGDLDQLHRIISVNRKGTRQRLLYLHAATPGIRSQVIGMALHEPVEGSVTEIVTEEQDWALQYGARRGSGRLAGHPLSGSADRI